MKNPKNTNEKLNKVKNDPQDEYYTPLWAIEKELKHYDFTNQVVYLNCDNPKISMFIKYFKDNFKALKVKKVIYTFLDKTDAKKGVIELINDELTITETKLKGNGSFDSDECLEIMKSCDIVVTNPPFSLLRRLVSLLVHYNKKFILLTPQHCVDYIYIFNLFKEERVFYGVNLANIDFYNPILNVTKKIGSMWLQNIKILRQKDYQYKYKTLEESPYIKLDNGGGICFNSYRDIPEYYDGIILAPVTILHNWDYNKFKALYVNPRSTYKGQTLFNRIAVIKKDGIKNKTIEYQSSLLDL